MMLFAEGKKDKYNNLRGLVETRESSSLLSEI